MALTVLVIVLAALATARLTRVIVDDKITEPIRHTIAARMRQPDFDDDGTQTRPGSLVTYLIFCSWCTGFWVALAVAAAIWWALLDDLLTGPWWLWWPLLSFALAYLAGLMKTHLDSE